MPEKTKKLSIALPAAAFWSVGWLAFVFLVCLIIYGFNIFLSSHWDMLSDKILWGFSGFSFMIFFAAAPAVYLAVLIQILRAKKFPFSFFKKPAKKTESAAPPLTAPEAEPAIKLPAGIPDELREPYLRMTRGQLARGAMGVPTRETKDERRETRDNGVSSAVGAPTAGGVPPESEPVDLFPLPDDFSESANAPDAPVFREISFGSAPKEPAPTESAHEIKITEKDGEKLAEFTHSDSDFWIADEDNWFASGKQIASPIKRLLETAAATGATPVLRLASTNVMDLETKRAEWENLGIRVEG
jgi:hypothetical protein